MNTFNFNTRSSNSDTLSYSISSHIRNHKRIFQSNFFARCITPWNTLPFELRDSSNTMLFSSGLKKCIWEYVLASPDNDNNYEIEPD